MLAFSQKPEAQSQKPKAFFNAESQRSQSCRERAGSQLRRLAKMRSTTVPLLSAHASRQDVRKSPLSWGFAPDPGKLRAQPAARKPPVQILCGFHVRSVRRSVSEAPLKAVGVKSNGYLPSASLRSRRLCVKYILLHRLRTGLRVPCRGTPSDV